jgi:hypothetical protein
MATVVYIQPTNHLEMVNTEKRNEIPVLKVNFN